VNIEQLLEQEFNTTTDLTFSNTSLNGRVSFSDLENEVRRNAVNVNQNIAAMKWEQVLQQSLQKTSTFVD
jgi:tRNA A37 threonylcarbamoyltransferase TsaD